MLPAAGPEMRIDEYAVTPSRVARWPYNFPLVVFEGNLNYGDAVRGLALAHLFGAPGSHTVAMKQPVVGVLVIDREQRPVGAQRKELDRVVVHAGLQRLFIRAVAPVPAEGGLPRSEAHGIAPAVKHLRAITGRNDDVIGSRGWNCAETEERRICRAARGAARQGCDQASEAQL